MFLPILEQVPEDIEITDDGCGHECAEYFTSVAVATCDVTEKVLSIDCKLTYVFGPETPPNCPFFHEFSFAVTVGDLNEIEVAFSTQDREIARRYLPEIIVPMVMPIVLNSCSNLIERVRPPTIYRVTKTRNPPPKALQKHDLITKLIEDKGYDVQENGTDPHDRAFWLHVRRQH